MRILKLGLISLVVFSLLITFLTLFFPSNVKVSRAIDINASKAQVEEFIRDPEKRKTCYPIDTARTITGSFNVIESGVPNTVTVQWFMDVHLGWLPWKKFSGLLLEKRYGPLLEKGLENLKKAINP